MTLKKGLTFVAFGFLFISVNINLNLNHLVLDLLPAFVGWIFFALAYSKLGSYTAYRQQFCWIPILLAVYTALDWLLAMLDIALNLPLLNIASLILEAVYMFQLFGCLEGVASDHAPRLEPRIHRLKTLYLALLIAVFASLVLALAAPAAKLFSVLTLLTALAFLVVIILICVTLFRLRKAIPDEDPALAKAGWTGTTVDS